MGDGSAIEWTDATWNPVTGCSHVSEGCRHCYAETLSLRMGWSAKPWTAQNARENVIVHHDRLDQPKRWKKPRRVFVNSMSDLFHELISFEFIRAVWAVMAGTTQHTYQILTKRPERMRPLVASLRRELPWAVWPLPNVWLGISCEDQRTADERIPILLDTPAAVRFISAEPLLGPINLGALGSGPWWNALTGCGDRAGPHGLEHMEQIRPLDWIICGGESGPHRRLMDPAWALSLRDQCVGAGVPFFFKQVGGRTPKAGGRMLDGRTWDEMPAGSLSHA
jgi:protein gp37